MGQIHVERSSVDQQRQELDAERKSVAAAAIREPVIAQAVFTVGLVLAALLPLVVVAYAIHRLPDQGQEQVDVLLAETLLEDLASEHPAGVAQESPPSLPAPTEPRLDGPAQSNTAGS